MSIIVPYEEIPPESLTSLITSFVLREGTDYGEIEIELDTKIQQVLDLLKKGTVKIVYSELEESFDILPSDSIDTFSEEDTFSEQDTFSEKDGVQVDAGFHDVSSD